MNDGSSIALGRVKILILKPSSLGDIIHAMPLLRVLKSRFPRAEIHWWVEEGLAKVFEGDLDVAKIQIFRRRNWRNLAGFRAELGFAWKLRDEKYDWVIDLQGLARSAWFGWFVGGRVIVGIDSGREGARALYDVIVSRNPKEKHAVDWFLDVANELGAVRSMDYEWLPKRLGSRDSILDLRTKWVVFCPGARWPNKRWPADHFALLAANLQLRDNELGIAILGDSGDAGLSKIIKEAAPGICIDLSGKTTFIELVECLRNARVVVANDSGPLHIAAALKRPMVALYGPTHPGRTGPYASSGSILSADISCVPCQVPWCANKVERECMKAIDPDVVADAVMARL